MGQIVNIHEAKTHLSRLVERVEAGEEVVIGRAGKPVARLVPFEQRRRVRIPGRLQGQIVIHDDFDADNVEIARLFEGDSSSPDR